MYSRHKQQSSTAVKDSGSHFDLTSQLKKLSISSHRRKSDEKRDDHRQPYHNRHGQLGEDYRAERRGSSGNHDQALSPVYESLAESAHSRHHYLPVQSQIRRTSTSSYRTITEVQHTGAIPNRRSYDRHVSELDDTSAPQSVNTSPRLRPPSINGSVISSITSLMSSQTRLLPDVRKMTFDQARVQLRGLQSRLANLDSPYSVSKYGLPQRNELKRFEKAAAALHRDCDHLVDRAATNSRNEEVQIDELKGEIEIFWEVLMGRLIRQKEQGVC